MKTEIKIVFILLILLIILTGCAYPESMINVISREDGSGTRDAFTSLFELSQKDEHGSEKDLTTSTSEITNSTAVVLQEINNV